LLASSSAAKVQAVDQNLIKKVVEILDENIGALNLFELQKASASKVQIKDTQRRLKYASSDCDSCEREIQRMLQIIRHLVFESGALLQDYMFTSNQPSEEF
jgi:hypothetical protein